VPRGYFARKCWRECRRLRLKTRFVNCTLPSTIRSAESLLKQMPGHSEDAPAARQKILRAYERLQGIDFFRCPPRTTLEELIAEIERRVEPCRTTQQKSARIGGVWVTRKGIKVDRIASAWLIKRFIDPQATFRFVTPDEYSLTEGETRFDII
jgi:hypothetical protein